ncbi:PLP-dependent aminotransferase family protein [Rhodococcus rhodnii]|nr:PLP-dependent aminotransferase family protein [Rhodococcus rhodnii]TXG92791.1 PLP-dependent aminotransferase family protein [Rhodococcus rhodnii]
MARTSSPVIAVPVLTDGPGPLPRRIADAVIEQIRTGVLGEGDVVPSTRSLAAALAVSRTAVVAAFDELTAAGWVDARAGSGTHVAPGARAAALTHAGTRSPDPGTTPPAPPDPTPGPPRFDLVPGRPDASLVDGPSWRRAWRRAAAAPIRDEVEAGGSAELRTALAQHLRRTRAVVASPDDIVVVPGVGAALRVLVRAAELDGAAVAFEDPGYRRARLTLTRAGARPRPVRVDHDGLDPSLLEPGDRAVYCTPAHQYPTGGRMPVARRAALIADARRHGRLVVEDDYDGEFRYDVAPLPALRATDGGADCVAYVGTASKILSPALRLAWIVVPTGLRERVLAATHECAEVSAEPNGTALAAFIESGALVAHLARAGRVYAARRAAFVAALRAADPQGVLTIEGIDAGLHVVVRYPEPHRDTEPMDERATAMLAERSVAAAPLSAYSMTGGDIGLVCGYARLPESQAPAAAAAVVATLLRCGAM